MTQLKVISNPYEQRIQYQTYDEILNGWIDVSASNSNSKLREDASTKTFFPFKIKDIIETIIEEYYVDEPVKVVFEGTQDDYIEAEIVCNRDDIQGKILLVRGETYLTNARYIFKDIREAFDVVEPLIGDLMQDDTKAIIDLKKVSDALKDIIPICVFGNYSCGKSTFINALIGYEYLPSGGDPVTAKVYEIQRSDFDDCAHIDFEYESKRCELKFEGKDFSVISKAEDIDLLCEIKEKVAQCDDSNIIAKVKCSLELINGYEKRDKAKRILGTIINLSVPFSPNGILGNSKNRFVIFDTPGSNSASNEEHAEVLKMALSGFSNGIPVWVSTYESADSEDNAKLCELVESIDALDKRFTMIVFNKADCSELGEDGLSETQISDILEYNSVEKMYASGVYFVSSIMGLGAKNNGELKDKHYRREYRTHQSMYEEPTNEDYTSLYKYNIMPEQIKVDAIKKSEDCEKIIYANSGLYCIEYEMETFATKHSAYNKCRMADNYLNSIINKTTKKIQRRTEIITQTRTDLETRLDNKTREIVTKLKSFRREEVKRIKSNSKPRIKNYVDSELKFERTPEDIAEVDKMVFDHYSKTNQLELQKLEYEEASKELVNHLFANFKGFFKKDPESGRSIKESFINMKDKLSEDMSFRSQNLEELNKVKGNIGSQTAEYVIHLTIAEYTKNMNIAYERIVDIQKLEWTHDSEVFKESLKNQITGSEELSEKQKKELESVIMNFPVYQYDNKAEDLFVKNRFMKGNFLGLKFGEIERVNTKSLTSKYNKQIKENISKMANCINDNYCDSFDLWVEELFETIEKNITSYNPGLKALVDAIEEQNVIIRKLESQRKQIEDSRERIVKYMSWVDTGN